MIDEPATGRRAILGVLSGAAVLGLAPQGAEAQSAAAPRQAWAHKDGKMALRPNVAFAFDPVEVLAIQQAFARYGMAYDEGQGDVLRSLFTEDAVLETAEASATPFQTVSGLPAIVANFANVFTQQKDQRRHCITNVLVEALSADRAKALAYGQVTVANGQLLLGATVFYTTDLVRGPDKAWRFRYMFIGMDAYVTPKPRV